MLERGGTKISRSSQPDAKEGRSSKRQDEAELNDLRSRLDRAEKARKATTESRRNRAALPAEAMALVGRIATEIVAGVAVGGFLGWMLDTWLGTSPIFMIVLFFLGAGAGMLNIWRMATGHGLKVGYFDQVDPEKDMPVDRMGKNSPETDEDRKSD
ncbi:AtpZ/AtpI family protein [Alphaproteobacteria bacterium LSUCC0684]